MLSSAIPQPPQWVEFKTALVRLNLAAISEVVSSFAALRGIHNHKCAKLDYTIHCFVTMSNELVQTTYFSSASCQSDHLTIQTPYNSQFHHYVH